MNSPTLNSLLLLGGRHRAVSTVSADGSADIARTMLAIHHELDYTIYGWGSAFVVTHKVTIKGDIIAGEQMLASKSTQSSL